MTLIRNAVIVTTGLVLMLLGDAPPKAPLPFQMVSDANAVFGVWRRHARRWAVVGTTVAVSSAAAASSAEHNQESATAQQQAATAQQQGAAAHPAGAPPVGTMVPTLPAGCASSPKGGVQYFNCGGVYYRPGFQSNNLMYVVVPQP